MPANQQGAGRQTGSAGRDRGRVGLVAAGAGARGAYEAGVLSVLMPAIGEELRPTILVGTSAGAINAAVFAAVAHLPVEQAVSDALDRWRTIHREMVIKPPRQTIPALVARNAAAMLGLSRPPVSLLDTAPLRRSLKAARLLDWDQIQKNIRTGVVTALAVVTTEFRTGRTKVFYDSARGTLGNVPKADDDRAVDYVRTRVTGDHVLASAAIPVAFPPVRLGTGRDASWHMDGGVRLNAPLKPAITLGAKRLVIVATDPPYYTPVSKGGGRREAPSIQEAMDHMMRGAMSDRMIEDLITLAHLNATLKSGGTLTRAGRKLELIEFVFGGPEIPGTLGAKAAETLDDILRGVGKLRRPDLALLSSLLSGGPNSTSRGDLMSYLLFEPEFIEAAIELGQQDGQAILRRPPLWKDKHFPDEVPTARRGPSGPGRHRPPAPSSDRTSRTG
jgi:NTE family protein